MDVIEIAVTGQFKCSRRPPRRFNLPPRHFNPLQHVPHSFPAAIVQRAPNQQQHPLAGLVGQAGLAAQLDQVLARLDQLQAGQAQLQAGQAQLLTRVDQLQAGQAQLLARQDNVRRRAQNLTAVAAAAQGLVVPLQPLGKELQPAVAGGAAVGAEPPGDAFPATVAALDRVGAGRHVVLHDCSASSA